jgi:hypothetical protein
MKSKKSGKGGKPKGKKGGKKGGKKQDRKPGYLIPEAERVLVPGFGFMVTKAWAYALQKDHDALMIEIARTNMQRYWDKVTDVQSKASLLLILGHSLSKSRLQEELQEGFEASIKAMELIASLGVRSLDDIVRGVWPEKCVIGWKSFNFE